MTERCHKETNSFHFPVGEMTSKLNDVSCIVHILIHGKFINHYTKISQEQGATLMSDLLGVDKFNAATECENMKGANIEFSWLEETFKEPLTKATQLENVVGRDHDRDNCQRCCVRASCFI